MSLVNWEDSFNIGLETFDLHHRHLVDMLNSIYQAVINQKGGNSLEDSFQELIAYCDYHFNAEEQWMAARQFPGQARHIASHRKFSQDILDFQKQFRLDQTLISFGLLKYLRDWLINHILDEDRLLAAHHALLRAGFPGKA